MGVAESVIHIGDQFGSWTVIGEGPAKGRNRYYLFRCICGTERSVRRSALVSGKSPNCGCGGVN